MEKRTLVLGASENPTRYANIAIKRLTANKVPTLALGLRKGEVSGVKIETEKVPFENVHTVTLYLGPPRQEEYYDYVISLKPERVIFNPGTENPQFYRMLQDNDIEVEVACTLVLLSTQHY